MAPPSRRSGPPHLSLSLSRELWNELLGATLPIGLSDGEFEMLHTTRQWVRRLEVRRRVAGLLPDRQPPDLWLRVKDRVRTRWRQQKPTLVRRMSQVISVRGVWRVELDTLGTELRYGRQKVAADAHVKGVAEGMIRLLRDNVEIPFRLERRLGATVALGDIHYDVSERAIIGTLQDLEVHLGESATAEVLGRLIEALLARSLGGVNPIPILRRDQVEEMVGSLGGALRTQMGVEDLELTVDERELTLHIRFGFHRLQVNPERVLPDRDSD